MKRKRSMKNNDYKKVLLINFRKEFINIANEKCQFPITNKIMPGKYTIVAFNENGKINDNSSIKAEFVLCPNSFPFKTIESKTVISCGMSNESTFGLSSINSERSMFFVNKAFNLGKELILPFEEPFKPDSRLSIYENIVLHGIEKITSSNFCFKY